MNTLEQIYEINFNKINFNERKIRIDYKNTIIKGPAKSGKSYLIYDYFIMLLLHLCYNCVFQGVVENDPC